MLSIILALVATPAAAQSPLRTGFYALAPTSCARAPRSYGDGVFVSRTGFEFDDGGRDIGSVAKLGPGHYRFTFVIENEMGRKSKLPSDITVNGAVGFTERLGKDTKRYIFCGTTRPAGWGL